LYRDKFILLPRFAGVLMLGVFSINSYIGLKDVALSKLQPAHEGANFLIAVIDLAAASLLLSYAQGKPVWIMMAGIVWPAVYFLSLAADIQSKLCLFTNVNCFASVQVAYEYLILGQASQGWVLWPYTFPTAIALFLLITGLSASYALLVWKYKT
jgi:hypothetical protein